MIVVDTSVWVAARRKSDSQEARTLIARLDADEVALAAPVRRELLSGASRRDRAALRRVLSALPLLYAPDATWTLMDQSVERAADAHEHFGVGDLLIAALTAEIGASSGRSTRTSRACSV